MINTDKVLFDKYYKLLCYFAWKMVKDKNLAEDLAQDAFAAYYLNKEKVSPDEAAVKAFLYSSIRFAVFNQSRKGLSEKKYWERTPYTEFDSIDFEQQIIQSEFTFAIHVALEQLPETCQKIFQLSYFDGLTTEEIAKEMEISINTIKTHKKRGLKALRNVLKPEYFSLFLLMLNQ
ncbi:RNA polymerase sigma factor [Sphingobacterium humi]|uniref:RNA polymerase sigma-70 factor n=1 Tax=Sphingobacterium humi TaxID=1796905 RepID=A0A6N8L177_9SPHI|nr:RNA polymerase sigma-70 factor [Sphingobacterium humi]MVZ61908.1 RNA polymerase sigma-70 factor [Sphingobacterium humi]